MTQLQKITGMLSATLCLSLIACGGSQERTKIGDRRGARDTVQNSKLLKADVVIKSCAADSGKTEDAKQILSLDGLAKGMTTAEADTLFASSFTSRIRITGANGDDLKNKKLSQTFLLEYGLQHKSATLKDIAPSLLNIFSENCDRVVMPLPAANEEPSLFFQMARLDLERLSTFSASLATPEDFVAEEAERTAEDPTAEPTEEEEPDASDTGEDDEVVEDEEVAEDGDTSEPAVAANTVEFLLDLEASSENMVVLKHPDGETKIIVKLVGDETLQVITEKPDQLTACGQNYSFGLRNEATLVWGKAHQEPVTIDYELYQTMLEVSNNNELLSNGAQENSGGRRAEGSSIQSVSLPEAFIGNFDDAIDQFHNNQSNVFDIQAVGCQ